MATVKQIAVRLTDDDVENIEAVMQHTGHVTMADTIRFVIRQYVTEHKLTPSKARKSKP